MSVALIAVQRGSGVISLGRKPGDVMTVGSPPVVVAAGLAVLPNGETLVVDGGGKLVTSAGGGWTTYGSAGAGVGEFRHPQAAAVAPDGTAYVADAGNRRIVRLVGFDGNGPQAGGWSAVGQAGTPAPFRFAHPTGVAASDDLVLVADAGNARLAAFPVTAFDTNPPGGWAEIALPAAPDPPRPYGVCRVDEGWAVSDVANAKVHLLDSDLQITTTIDTSPLRLGVPAYLAGDALGRLLVADPSANEVRLLRKSDRDGRVRTVWRCRGSDPKQPRPLFEQIVGVSAAAS